MKSSNIGLVLLVFVTGVEIFTFKCWHIVDSGIFILRSCGRK